MIDKNIQNIYYSVLHHKSKLKQDDKEICIRCCEFCDGNDIYELALGQIITNSNTTYWGFIRAQLEILGVKSK